MKRVVRWTVFSAMGLGAMSAITMAVFSTSIPSSESEVEGIPDRFVELLLEKPVPSERAKVKRPMANPDAGEGAKAKKEEGKVGKRVSVRRRSLDRAVGESAGILGALGSGLAGGGTAEGLGGLGSKGIGSGRSGYGYAPPAPVSQDYVDYGHNPVELAEEDFLSTFSIDVDTGSYTQARRSIEAGGLPAAAAVRTEEFVNYMQYEYPQPERGVPFAVTMEASAHPWNRSHHIMRVGIQGAEVAAADRTPVHLTFLVDTSCSMNGPDRLPMAKEALHHLVDNLEPDDTVALATYAGATRRVLLPTRPGWDAHKAIDDLTNGGGTAMESGMTLAYEMAEESFVAGHENRVIVLSDGDANIGASSHEQILSSLREYAQKGITLSTVGFGSGNYRDTMMEQLANKGDGNYQYIDTLDEAKRVFGEDLDATLRTIARDVKIQVAFNPDNVIAYKLIGYENREIADDDFRDDKVDAGEVGAGHTVTALYDLVLRDNPEGALATVQVRHKKPGPDGPATEQAVELPASAVGDQFWFSSPNLRLAWGAASFAEKLRGAKEMEEVEWGQIIEVVDGARRPGTERDDEVLSLVRLAAAYEPPTPLAVAQAKAVASDAIILGAVARADVESVVQRHMAQIQYCYARERAQNPNLRAGKLVEKFVIAKDGTVSSASTKTTTIQSASVNNCITGRFMRMKFPAPKGGGIAIVSYPLIFSAT